MLLQQVPWTPCQTGALGIKMGKHGICIAILLIVRKCGRHKNPGTGAKGLWIQRMVVIIICLDGTDHRAYEL